MLSRTFSFFATDAVQPKEDAHVERKGPPETAPKCGPSQKCAGALRSALERQRLGQLSPSLVPALVTPPGHPWREQAVHPQNRSRVDPGAIWEVTRPGRDLERCAAPRPRGEGPGCARELRVTRGHRALPCAGSWGLDLVPTGAGGQAEGSAAERRRRAGPGGAGEGLGATGDPEQPHTLRQRGSQAPLLCAASPPPAARAGGASRAPPPPRPPQKVQSQGGCAPGRGRYLCDTAEESLCLSPWTSPTHSLGQLGKTKNPQCRNDIHDSDGSSSSSNQGPKSTAKWASSLETLLEDPEGVMRFREFLKKEFSEENVLFWLACEDFKKLEDKKQMQEKAKEIYMTFLSNKASSQVNVEGQSRLSEKFLEEPHPLMFQKLQEQIFNLMKYDSYSRFLKSDLFLKHNCTDEEEEEPPDAQTAAKRASRIYNT
ncbi:regulator of G-protein signaling 10 isoform X1 [Cricetulus griseus]|uniref:regulator of G-protein signaling 10 isoform X1 n=1 Tax=Cricetulus griseus TaxID=10029 RepID=UPI0015C3EB78|nr:regulator of G-protein signaling 10 isoform X1 [Cricetulus griseus]